MQVLVTGGTIALLQAMCCANVRNLVFNSSATVYGEPNAVPVAEEAPLRYFNPVGAYPSGCIGEDPGGFPNNLTLYVAQVAVGRHVFGADYPTPDGTGVRDYIHVMDLAGVHARAGVWCQPPRRKSHQCRHRARLQSAGSGARTRRHQREACLLPNSCAPSGRRRVTLGRLGFGKGNSWLAREPTCRRDVLCSDTWRWHVANQGGYRYENS